MAKTARKTDTPSPRTDGISKAQPAPHTIDTDSPDVQMLRSDGSVIQQFLAGLVPFFLKATEAERSSVARLARVRTLVAPKDADADGRMQMEIKDANAAIEEAEELWNPICAAFFGVHRKLTAKRGLTIGDDKRPGYLLQAKMIAQQHHNRYSEEAERQRQAENRRLQQEAEARARQDRERELELIEQEALKAEAASTDLSEREEIFITRIVDGDLPVRAAQATGYKDPQGMATRLLDTPKIAQAITGRQSAKALREQASAVREMPVQTTHYEAEKQIKKIGTDRTTWSAEVYDVEAFMAVVLDPTSRMRYGVPADVATFVQTKVNDLAKALHEKLDVVPGIRAKKNVSTY